MQEAQPCSCSPTSSALVDLQSTIGDLQGRVHPNASGGALGWHQWYSSARVGPRVVPPPASARDCVPQAQHRPVFCAVIFLHLKLKAQRSLSGGCRCAQFSLRQSYTVCRSPTVRAEGRGVAGAAPLLPLAVRMPLANADSTAGSSSRNSPRRCGPGLLPVRGWASDEAMPAASFRLQLTAARRWTPQPASASSKWQPQ